MQVKFEIYKITKSEWLIDPNNDQPGDKYIILLLYWSRQFNNFLNL